MHDSQLTLWKLEVFGKVIEERSFSAAARLLGISQPTVSSHIAALEKAIGSRLFDRVDGEVATTPVGAVLYEESRRILDQHRQALQNVMDFLGVVRGTLKIGGSTIPGNYILPRYVMGFRTQHPGIQVEIQCSNSARVLERIQAGDVEIGVLGEKPHSDAFRSWPFEEDEVVLAVPPDHELAPRRAVELAELEKHPHVVREVGSGTRALVERAFARRGFELAGRVPVACQVGSSEGVRQAVLAGLGVGLISNRAIAEEVRSGRLAALRVEGVELRRRFYVATSARRSQSPLARSFLAFVRKEAPRPSRKRR